VFCTVVTGRIGLRGSIFQIQEGSYGQGGFHAVKNVVSGHF
jgi:hypothetical protein